MNRTDTATMVDLLRDLPEELTDGILVVEGSALLVRYVNHALEMLLQTPRSRLLDQPAERALRAIPSALTLVRTALETGSSCAATDLSLLPPEAPPGEEGIPIEARAFVRWGESGRPCGAILLLRDRTVQADLEVQLERSHRLALFGELAAGVAHEIKNPLAGIRGAAELLVQELAPGDRRREYPEIIVREATRLDALVRRMLDLGRPAAPERVPTNLHQLADAALALVRAEGRDRVIFETEYDPSLPELALDGTDIAGVIVNLLRNAADAVESWPDGRRGTVFLRTFVAMEFAHATEGLARRMACLEIRDEGPGMEAAVQASLFTPFFTTRPGGTGLGLVLSQRSVTAHGGVIRIHSRTGIGTTVRTYLPL